MPDLSMTSAETFQ